MLLPSPLACDSAQASSRPRLQPAHFVSPPASPPMLSPPQSFGNIMVACRSLHSLMATPPAPSLASLPTPPMAHAPMPPKLRLRTPRPGDASDGTLFARRRIAKRTASPPASNKRRHPYDNVHPGQDEEPSLDDAASLHSTDDKSAPPSTPKRARIAPEHLLGLARSDFHDVHSPNNAHDDDDAVGAEWNPEDDRVLVELVLDKLKLSKTEWQECARSIGKDRHSVGRRWKSLMAKGDVGLKARGPSRRRATLHHTWR